MARIKGYQIEERKGRAGVSLRVKIYVPSLGRYGESKTFTQSDYANKRETERAAKRWAEKRVDEYSKGVATPVTRKCKTAELLEMYLNDREARGGNPTQLANVKRRLRDLPLLCPFLSGPHAAKQVYQWWLAWCDEPCQIGGRNDQKLSRSTTGKPKSIRTRNNGLTDAKAFVNWCFKFRAITGMDSALDLDWIEKLRAEQTIKPQFTVDELHICTLMIGHSFHLRWCLGVFLGARSAEMGRIAWADFSGNHVILRGKGRKERLVPVPPELAGILEYYKQVSDFDGYLFEANYRSSKYGNIPKRFDDFLAAARIPKNGRSLHSLRHCYAGLMTATGESTALLQAYMGHSQSDMTRHYAQYAARYRDQVDGWERGELRILTGAASVLPHSP